MYKTKSKPQPVSHTANQTATTAIATRSKQQVQPITKPVGNVDGRAANVDYMLGFQQLTKAMEDLNQTILAMNTGLTSRLDELMTRLDTVDNNMQQIQKGSEEANKDTCQKFVNLEKLLSEAKLSHAQTNRKLREQN